MVSRYHESNGLWMQLSRLAGEAGMIGQLENGIWERFLPVKKNNTLRFLIPGPIFKWGVLLSTLASREDMMRKCIAWSLRN